MVNLLEEIKTVPGVVGAFVFDARRGVVASAMPSLFRPEKLERIGRGVNKIRAAGHVAFPGSTSVLMAFEEAQLTSVHLSDEAALVVMSASTASPGLIAMSVKLILPELRSAAAEGSGAVRTAEAETPRTESGRSLSPAELLQSPDFEPALAAFEKALARAIGPIARVVLADGLKAWTRSEAPSRSGLARLADLLEREIKDPLRASAFRQAVAPHAGAGGGAA